LLFKSIIISTFPILQLDLSLEVNSNKFIVTDTAEASSLNSLKWTTVPKATSGTFFFCLKVQSAMAL
jgi:hypothetical protein